MPIIYISESVRELLDVSKKTHPTLTYSDIIYSYWGCSSEEAKYVSMDMTQQYKENKEGIYKMK